MYYNENLTALGFGPYEFGDIARVSWDTNNDGESEYSGQTVRWTPSEVGEKTITVTYRNGNASLSRTQTVTISDGDSRSISDYTNGNSIVDARGLQDAAADFRNGEVGSDVLLDASAAFRNGSPIS
ncbi:hypothetical protein [Halorubrum ezzemoulense]|uniref:hypothetical protein n=1 Tax=Halorubrum ezzemoulense TaxID=337243 RepID=UPI00232AB033|nr:hypothetical protein [Halorubrum ezzemoulense]